MRFTRALNTALVGCVLVLGLAPGCKQEKSKSNQQHTTEKWYSNVVIYNLDVDAFKDSDGDGIGDFRGLTERLGYLDTLGIDVIWLAPFQPSPGRDDGYDITDYYGVDPRLGTKSDFDAFMVAVKAKGLKVIMDIVVNHTSVEHPWFKAARQDTTSKYHQWYVWSPKKPKDWDKGMVFPGVQEATWTYDELAGKYYFHRFYDFQPDLNFQRADVRAMAIDVLSYWLKQGMDGFRLDAVPFIIDIPETGSDKPEHMPNILTDITTALRKINPEVALLGEANVTAEENAGYFGNNGDRLQMMFNFYSNQFLFYSLAKGETSTFAKALEDFRDKPASCQWVFFLRNHDEVDLARLGKGERQLVYDKMGPESNMQLYDRGIRRRLAPMLGDSSMVRMAYSLLFSLPGAQLIRYGEEIGMGDDLTLPERLSVRTPMQWENTHQAGFSSAAETFRPVIEAGEFGYKKVNVKEDFKDTSSLLSFMVRLIELRKQHPEIGLGNWEILDSGSPNVFLMSYKQKDKTLIVAHNFTKEPREFSIDPKIADKKTSRVIFGETAGASGSPGTSGSKIKLNGYGFVWMEY